MVKDMLKYNSPKLKRVNVFCYSYFNAATGLMIAAFAEWKLTVNKHRRIDEIPAITKMR